MKDKIKYYLLLLAFLFIMALILWFFHDWIEQYSNSLMVLITFIYVVATIEICRANIKSAEATKEQLEESKHQFAENERLQMMPYFEIIVHDDIRDFVECIELTISNSNAENSTVIDRRISIKNIGLGVAKDFTYTWCNLDGCYLRNDLGFTALVWTSLCEKRILTPSFGRWDLPPKAIHMSSVYYLKDGKIAKASETLFEDRLYY